MRTHQILLLAVGLTLAACDDPVGPATGTLRVSTYTDGGAPEQAGYRLAVDEVDSLDLDPTGTAEVNPAPGRHTLRLVGVAAECTVAPGTSLDIDIARGSTTPVAFEISCPPTGDGTLIVSTKTTGVDLDTDGYRVEVDGIERGILPSSGSVLTHLEPGGRTITLTGLSSNCTLVGPGSHTVTIVAAETALIDFVVACTATTGLIGVTIEASGESVGGEYQALLDGRAFFVGLGTTNYLPAPAGDHVVSVVAPANCSVETDPQSITVTAGGLIRDTAYVSFSVTCTLQFGRIRITAPTTGPLPVGHRYEVIVCTNRGFICPWEPILRRKLAANDTLIARYGIIEVSVELKNIPASCRVQTANPTPFFTIPANNIRDVRFPIVCGP